MFFGESDHAQYFSHIYVSQNLQESDRSFNFTLPAEPYSLWEWNLNHPSASPQFNHVTRMNHEEPTHPSSGMGALRNMLYGGAGSVTLLLSIDALFIFA